YKNANPDEALRAGLIQLFTGWKNVPDRKEELADQILDKIHLRVSLDKTFYNPLSPAENLSKLNDYITAIKNLRKAWLALPTLTKEILPEFISDIEDCLLPPEVTRNLSSIFYSEKSKLPEWRKTGMNSLERWSCDLELIDLMRST